MKFSTLLSCAVFFILTAPQAITAAGTNTTDDNLPDFNYTLLDEPLGKRKNICDQNTAACAVQCGGPDQAPKNFCNPKTMGWGCGCKSKKPDYEDYEWPISQQHCLGSNTACQKACSGRAADKLAPCQDACTTKWGSTCGTEDQPATYYNVDSFDDKPTYKPPVNSTGNSTGNSTEEDSGTGGHNANAANALGPGYAILSAVFLAIVAAL